jgi:cytochrome P450
MRRPGRGLLNQTHQRVAQPTTEAFVERLYAEAAAGRFGVRAFGRMILVDEPEAIQQVLSAPDVYFKDYGVVETLGLSRFNTNGADWRMRQALTQRHYAAAARDEHRPAVASAYRERMAALSPPTPEGLRDAMLAAASSVFHRALGCEMEDAMSVRLLGALRNVTGVLQRLALFGYSQAAMARTRAEIAAIFAAFERHAGNAPDFAAMLERMRDGARDPDFRPLQEYAFNLSAGVETSASAMSWVLDRLGALPELQERCAAEVRSGTERPLTERFIDEAMRRFPPVPFHVRVATAASRVGAVEIPAGARLVLSVIGSHHHPDYWSRPFQLDPERPEFDGTKRSIAYMPFSAGQRICGGMRIARIEASAATAAALALYRVRRRAAPMRFCMALAMRADCWGDIELAAR